MIQRQIFAHIPQLRDELVKKVPNAWSAKTIDLIEGKLQEEFKFIKLKGNLITFSTIMAEAEQKELNESYLKNLPSGARVEFREEGFDILFGSEKKNSQNYQNFVLMGINQTPLTT